MNVAIVSEQQIRFATFLLQFFRFAKPFPCNTFTGNALQDEQEDECKGGNDRMILLIINNWIFCVRLLNFSSILSVLNFKKLDNGFWLILKGEKYSQLVLTNNREFIGIFTY